MALTDKRIFMVSKMLKDGHYVLEKVFFTDGRQHITNVTHVMQVNHSKSILIMDNGEHLPIARNQKERLGEKYGFLLDGYLFDIRLINNIN